MKKGIIIVAGTAVLLSSCGSYTASGAYIGSNIGSVFGSAIGGINDGPRGSDVGTIIGMAGGAIIGGVIGNMADKSVQNQGNITNNDNNGEVYQHSDNNDSGFDANNSADDRIYDFNGTDYTGDYSAQQPTTVMPESSSVEELAEKFKYTPNIEVRNVRFVDDNQDNTISRGELCKVIFEVMNRGEVTLYDVQPTVIEATGNKHILVSPGLHIEKIAPGKGIRYTALVKADNRLKAGTIRICVSVVQDSKAISKVSEFNIPTTNK